MKRVLLIILFMSLTLDPIMNIQAKQLVKWPLIRSLKQVIYLEDHKNPLVKIKIMSADGKASLYLLECLLNTWDENLKENNNGYIYRGSLECRLVSFNENNEFDSLLREEKNVHRPLNRGVFRLSEIRNLDIQQPGHGRIRVFKLRGMRLTVNVKKYRFDKEFNENKKSWDTDRIKDLQLEITAVPDKTATTDIAEPANIAASHK